MKVNAEPTMIEEQIAEEEEIKEKVHENVIHYFDISTGLSAR